MKKGFFLLEALLACTLLMILVGVVIHHYAQWSVQYKKVIQQKNAISILMMLIEKGADESFDTALYTVTKKNIRVDPPQSSLPLSLGITYPDPQCAEIIVSWQGDSNTSQAVCAIVRRQ